MYVLVSGISRLEQDRKNIMRDLNDEVTRELWVEEKNIIQLKVNIVKESNTRIN